MASVSTPKYNLKDLGMPMYPSGFNRLMAVDLEGVKLRYYSKKDFFWVVNKLKYNDLNALNKDVVLGRQVTEAAWLKVLLRTYTKWDPKELSKKFPGEEMKEKKRMLREALFERHALADGDVGKYWQERAALCPGLDIADIPDDTDDDHVPQPSEGDHVTDGDSEVLFEAEIFRELRGDGAGGMDEEDEDMEMGDEEMEDDEMEDVEMGADTREQTEEQKFAGAFLVEKMGGMEHFPPPTPDT